MSLRGLTQAIKAFFGGAWTAPDPVEVDGRGALTAQNVQFFNKHVGTRYGFGVAFSMATQPSSAFYLSMYNWVSSLGNYLVWWGNGAGTGIHAALISNVPPTPILIHATSTGFWASTYAQAGPRLYQAFWVPNSFVGPDPGSNAAVISQTSGTFNYDAIIPGPPSTTLVPNTAPTEPSGGVVTAGLHNLGLRMLHRSGFLGRPGPDTSTSTNPTPSTFAPIQFTSSGAKNLQWAFTPGANWPADVVQVQVVMSPVNNPNKYFLVPGAVQNVTGGAATPVSITINIDDGSLVSGAAAIEATNSLNFYTASATGQAFMQVAVVVQVGTRMAYVSQLPDANGNNYSVVFFSDPGAFQQISISEHAVQLPNQLKITSVFSVQGSIYIIGPHWTYVTQDTGDVPATWATPAVVDNRKGALYPNCVEVNVNGLYAWIADKTGLYFFNGAYSQLPISWYQNDIWAGLVFPRASMVIKDDPLRHIVRVLGTQTTALSTNSIYRWDYTNGLDPNSARFSVDNFNFNEGTFAVIAAGSMEIVQNDLNAASNNNIHGSPELWLCPGGILASGTEYFWREKNPASDATPYSDDGATRTAIHTIYEPPIVPEAGISWPGAGTSAGSPNILAHQAMVPRITGNGTITPVLYGIDKTVSKNFPTITLSTSPGGRAGIQRCYLKSYGFIYHFEQNTVDYFFILTDYTTFYSKYASNR